MRTKIGSPLVVRRFVRKCLLPGILSSTLVSPRFAIAAPNDAAAQRLRDQAIEQDYLATNYAAAEKKLTEALGLCEKTSNCSPFIRARLHCDLAVVELMLRKIDLARTEFATALVEDPNIALDPNLSSTDAQREFAAVKSGSPAPSSPLAAPPSQSAPSQGGMVHVPPARQAVMTPLPLYAEVPADLGATKLSVRYKPAGARDWKTVLMRPLPSLSGPAYAGYGVELPCAEVGNGEGELRYFVQAHDANGDLVASGGRSAAPYSVAIVKRLEGEPPHLPNQPPPQACNAGPPPTETAPIAEASDCPPGFPGCHTARPTSCESREDCMSGDECVDRTCRRSGEIEREYKKNWLSFGVQAELLLMPGAQDACIGNAGYTCFRSDNGSYYSDVPAKGVDDQVLAGFATAPMIRIMVGYDRVVLPNLTVGGRLGYAVSGGGPKRPDHGATGAGPSFMPLHVEVRLAYWLGKNVFARKGMRLYGALSGGMSEIDASEAIDVAPPGSGNSRINIDAWTKTGLGFAALGPGAMYAFTANGGLVLEAKAIVLFPTSGFALGAQLAYTIGF
jgi:hypothetical protein